MLRDGQQAMLRVRLGVSAQGAPTECHMQLRMAEEDFEGTACEDLLEHARFEPALDAGGKPIASYWITAITYIVR